VVGYNWVRFATRYVALLRRMSVSSERVLSFVHTDWWETLQYGKKETFLIYVWDTVSKPSPVNPEKMSLPSFLVKKLLVEPIRPLILLLVSSLVINFK